MGLLYLVRHAQASFLSANYDQLSARGEAQARLLGEYWSRRKLIFDRVACGPAARHRHTAQIARDVYHKHALVFPEPVAISAFDEFQGDAVLSSCLPRLLEENRAIRDLHQSWQNSSSEAEQHFRFQRLFQAVMEMWVRGELVPENVESWAAFTQRVNRGLSQFLADAKKGETAAIFSSGGPISVAMQRALNLSQFDTLGIAWMIRNCSFSEFLFSADRFTLSSFNSFPHLEDTGMLTYR
jgi:broad specificity phosphatase PhoE